MADPLYPNEPDEPESDRPSTGRFSLDHYKGNYKTNWIDIQIEHDSGRRQMAVAGDPDADPPIESREILVHAGCTKKVVEFHVVRQILQPDVPSPEPPDDNHFLMHVDFRISGPAIIQDGINLEWTCQGRYEFGMRKPYRPGKDAVQGPVLPWTTVTLEEALLAVERFKRGQIATADTPPEDLGVATPG